MILDQLGMPKACWARVGNILIISNLLCGRVPQTDTEGTKSTVGIEELKVVDWDQLRKAAEFGSILQQNHISSKKEIYDVAKQEDLSHDVQLTIVQQLHEAIISVWIKLFRGTVQAPCWI